MKKEYTCKKCGRNKDINDFYKSNLSLCKECKKNINKLYREEKRYKEKYADLYNNNIEILTLKINSIELLINEILKNLKFNDIIFKDIYERVKIKEENTVALSFEKNLNEIDKTINIINNKNKNIDEIFDNIINKNNNFYKNEYEQQLKDIINT